MNIVHLSKSDDRGAFIAAYRFHKQLCSLGYNSLMLVEKKTTRDTDVIEVKLNLFDRVYVNSLKLISKYLIRKKTNPRYSFFNYFESFTYPAAALEKSLSFRPDIICTHWVTGFVNTKTLYQFQHKTGASVVWRFNDYNPFTGGCHYPNGCINYFNSCGNCPALYSGNPYDRSYRNLKKKIKWLSKTDITFISSTTEIDEHLRNSTVSKFCKIKKIMLACGSDNFIPGNKSTAAKDLGLQAHKKIIFFGAQSMNDPRKGFKALLEALHHLKKIVPAELAEKILLVYASKVDIGTVGLPFQHIRLPFLQGDAQLAKAYQAATIFVSPSIEDAGPMMIAESMLCGTPVVAFAVGLAKDAVVNNVSGFIIDRYDTTAFAEALFKILDLDEDHYNNLSKSSSGLATQLFSVNREMEEVKKLFSELRAPAK